MIENRRNQLEESYHFKEELDCFSFIYKGKKAFILNIKENPLLIGPFMTHRKKLANKIAMIDADKSNKIKDYYEYLLKCIPIIANMLDNKKMGSVTAYLDHIWSGLEEIVENDDKKEFVKYVNEISDIVSMIDLTTEHYLNNMNQSDIQTAITSHVIKQINPDLEVIDILEITKDGTIKKLNIKATETNKKQLIDLASMKPLNTKEI